MKKLNEIFPVPIKFLQLLSFNGNLPKGIKIYRRIILKAAEYKV